MEISLLDNYCEQDNTQKAPLPGFEFNRDNSPPERLRSGVKIDIAILQTFQLGKK